MRFSPAAEYPLAFRFASLHPHQVRLRSIGCTFALVAASGADTAEHFERVVCGNHGITFREQAEIWLEQMKNRRRKPGAPSTLSTWESCLENWLNPNIGHMPLDNVKNLSLKNLGIKMVEGGLGESAIRSYTNVVKMVVASAVNEEGEELYPRKWNHSFIDLPRTRNPKQPSFAGAVVTRICCRCEEREIQTSLRSLRQYRAAIWGGTWDWNPRYLSGLFHH